jgi:hypothetical protein
MATKAYEFSTKVTLDGKLIIPKNYTKYIPTGDAVRVIVLVDELGPQESQEELLSLEKVIAEIKSMPTDPANIQPGSGLLAEHLANTPGESDPSFDVDAWNKAWDKIEAEMEAIELAHDQAELDI